MIELRPYQNEHAGEVRQSFLDGFLAVLLVLATGAGKTIIFCYIALMAAMRGNSVLILAHRDALIKQASRKLNENGVDHGIIMAGYTPKPYCKVQVASVQTMVRRIKKQKFDFKLIIVDEAHLSCAKSYHLILGSMPDARVLGVTGTAGRLDGKGLGRHAGGHFDKIIVGTSTPDLIKMGWLVRPVVYAPEAQLDLSSVEKTKGDYDEAQLAAVVDRPVITGSAVEHYKRICNGVPAVAWCINLKHAEHVAAELTAAGIPAAMLKGDHTGDERDAVMAKLTSGEIKVVTFCQLLVEGVDCPAIGCIILLRPTYSLTSYLQVIGRGLRPDPADPSKVCCYVLDHAGLTWRHGLADEVREWTLDGVKKRKKKDGDKKGPKVDIVQCNNCWAVFNAAPICPQCGQDMPKRTRTIEEVEGELHEVTPEMVAARRKNRNREIHAAQTLDDLRALGQKYGYKDGWADVKWQFVKRQREYREQREQERDEERLAVMATYKDDPAFSRWLNTTLNP